MAITVGTGTLLSAVTTSPQTTSVTVASGSDRALVVVVGNNGAQTVTGITYNGVAMTEIYETTIFGAYTTTAYILIGPATGANNLTITWSANPDSGQAWAQPFYGVNQTGGVGNSWRTPTTAVDDESGTQTTATVTAANAVSGDMVFDALGIAVDPTVGAGQTQQQQWHPGAGFARFAMSTEAASGSTVMSWTTASGTFWNMAAVPLIPAGGATAHVGEARFNGSGSLSANVISKSVIRETLPGVGSLSANVTAKLLSEARFNGTGSLSVDAQKSAAQGAGALNGSGSLAANVIQRHVEGARFAGAGSFSADVTQISGAVTRTLVSWAQLRGQAPVGVQAWPAQAIFNGSGALSVNAERWTFAQATFAGAGSFSVNVTARFAIQATFGGAGSLSVNAQNTKTAQATFQGSGNLSANAILRMQVQATFQGTGNLSAEAVILGAVVQHSGNAVFNGTGNLSVNVLQLHSSSSIFGGAGNYSVNVIQRQQVEARFSGAGSVSANALQGHAAYATFAGAGSVSADTIQQTTYKQGEARFAGAGNFRVNVTAKYAAEVRFTGTGNLLCTVSQGDAASVQCSGSGALSVSATVRQTIQARFNGAGNLSFSPFVLAFGSSLVEATFGGRGGMFAQVTLIGPRHVQSTRPVVSGAVRSNEAVGGRSNVATGTRRNAA